VPFANPFSAGIRAARVNLIPGLLVQVLMVALVLVYYSFTPARTWFQTLAFAKASASPPPSSPARFCRHFSNGSQPSAAALLAPIYPCWGLFVCFGGWMGWSLTGFIVYKG
jgi:hypothetical protein